MGGLPVVFIGYEVADNTLEAYGYYEVTDETLEDYGPDGWLLAIRALLRDVEAKTHCPTSLVCYDDDENDLSRKFVCCFTDTRRHAYTPKELESIPIPAEFARVPEWVKTSSDLQRVFAPHATIFRNREPRVQADAVISAPSSTASQTVASADLGTA